MPGFRVELMDTTRTLLDEIKVKECKKKNICVDNERKKKGVLKMSEEWRNFRCHYCGRDVGLEDGVPINPCACIIESEIHWCEFCGYSIAEDEDCMQYGSRGEHWAHIECFEEEATGEEEETADIALA